MKSSTVFFGIQINWLAVFAGVFCLTMAIGASAEENGGPCAEDVARLCKDVGPLVVVQCILRNKEERKLSPVCTQALVDAEKLSKKLNDPKFREACDDDLKDFCERAPKNKTLECLKSHEADLASECKEAMQ